MPAGKAQVRRNIALNQAGPSVTAVIEPSPSDATTRSAFSAAQQGVPRKRVQSTTRAFLNPPSNSAVFAHVLADRVAKLSVDTALAGSAAQYASAGESGIATHLPAADRVPQQLAQIAQKQFDDRHHYFLSQQLPAAISAQADQGLFASTSLGSQPSEALSPALLAALNERTLGACCAEPSDAQQDVPAHDCESGMIAVDLDEAAHGAYASVKYLADGFGGKPDALAQTLKADASLLVATPKQALMKEIVPSGTTDFAAGVRLVQRCCHWR